MAAPSASSADGTPVTTTQRNTAQRNTTQHSTIQTQRANRRSVWCLKPPIAAADADYAAATSLPKLPRIARDAARIRGLLSEIINTQPGLSLAEIRSVLQPKVTSLRLVHTSGRSYGAMQLTSFYTAIAAHLRRAGIAHKRIEGGVARWYPPEPNSGMVC